MRFNAPIGGILLVVATESLAAIGAAGGDRCGVGSLIWGDGQSISSQSSEESTNHSSFAVDSLSITSGTSGCSNSGLVDATKEEIHYVNVNFEELLVDVSQGRGETLSGLIAVMGCQDSSADKLANAWQGSLKGFANGTTIDGPHDLLLLVKSTVGGDPGLARACGA